MRHISQSTTYQRISKTLDTLEQDALLGEEENFLARLKAIDFLELEVLDTIESADAPESLNGDALTLRQRAQVLKQKLDHTNERLFTRLLTSIRSNDRSTLKRYLTDLQGQISARADQANVGYDEIDTLVWGLLEVDLTPEEAEELEPEMVYYQPTSTRTLLKLISELHMTADDLFYDLGSGLGYVPILVNLLTGVRTKGIEIQEFYYRYSIECLNKLGLSDVEFINADARYVDYDDGTIFYLYTPFRGTVLQHVLGKLEEQSKRRQIRVCTLGPCTSEIAEHSWLQPIYQTGGKEAALGIFSSI